MNTLSKLQNLPEKTRKIILWLIMIIIGSGLFFWWIRGFQDKMEDLKKDEFMEEMKIPELKEQLEKNLSGNEI